MHNYKGCVALPLHLTVLEIGIYFWLMFRKWSAFANKLQKYSIVSLRFLIKRYIIYKSKGQVLEVYQRDTADRILPGINYRGKWIRASKSMLPKNQIGKALISEVAKINEALRARLGN